jgi:PRP38 family
MANRTDPEAASVHGTNPQNLVEKIIRSKIYNSMYWKEHCFALNAETVIDKCMDLKAVGGTLRLMRPSAVADNCTARSATVTSSAIFVQHLLSWI